ncbi:MAG: SoxY-related AACIE arm protein [Rubrivivax sp.]|nr:SoxY-related AACIE arm protein [Rubrivivax sp.]
MVIQRRQIVLAGALAVMRPLGATPEALQAAVRDFVGSAPLRDGRIRLDVAPLVENGNTVPLTVTVDSPMTAADHVRTIVIFNELNPQHDVALFELGPRAGRATVATRIRLATSQKLVALARLSDGSCWRHQVEVVVTLAACVEG